MRRPAPALLAPLALLIACGAEAPEAPFAPAPPAPLSLTGALDATMDDPILLTFAAARTRASYVVDEGYTFTRGSDGSLAFATDTAGDVALAFEVDGRALVREGELASPLRIVATSSDAMVARGALTEDLALELRFATVTSELMKLEVHVESRSPSPHRIAVAAALRRCAGGYTSVGRAASGVRGDHHAEPPGTLPIVGRGTYVEDFAGALVSEVDQGDVRAFATCAATSAEDSARALASPGDAGESAQVLAVRVGGDVPAGESRVFRFARAVVDARDPAKLDAALTSPLSATEVVVEGQARMAKAPSLAGASRDQALVLHSSFALLDQMMMPAEGRLAHPYFLFAREPTWDFARLGMHAHEALALVPLARMDVDAAVAALDNMIERTEPDGYLPYNFGPVVELAYDRTASAPFFAPIARDVAARKKDRAFLARAYAAAEKQHRFWVKKRDKDGNGLSEWGGLAHMESVRDLDDAVWTEVAEPSDVDSVDLNSMLVATERALADMAEALGDGAAAARWGAEAEERIARINASLWDEGRGFYFHRSIRTGSFSHRKAGDLLRVQIAGALPLWAGAVPRDRLDRVVATVMDPAQLGGEFGVRSLSARDSFYSSSASSCCRWNGVVWVQWQWMLARGLRAAGRAAEARTITERTVRAVSAKLRELHQFRELYDPDDARAPNLSMPNYNWSAMVGEMILEAAAR